MLTLVTELSPSANSLDAALSTPVTATFDNDILPTTATNESFVVHSASRGRLHSSAAAVTALGRTVILTPQTEFFPGEVVSATATPQIRDTLGDAVEPHTWQFRASVTAGTGLFSDSGLGLGDHASRAVEFGDLDGDGDLDAFVANADDQGNRVWLNEGYLEIVDSGQNIGSSSSYAVALGDLDGDGDLDAFVANSGANRLWWNNQGVFSDSGQLLGDRASQGIALGDLDGDGDLDALVANKAQGNRVWINVGGLFEDSGQDLGSHATVAVALGDLDGDGDLDAFAANDDFQGNRVWLGDGHGHFADSGQSLGDHRSSSVSLGDLDGDGDLDAFVTNRNEGNQVLLNAGTWFRAPKEIFGNANQSAAFGDLDGDGDLDVFIANGGGQGSPIFKNNGFGTLTNSGQSLGNHSSSDVALGDLDGDGDLDALITNPYEQDRVWFNGTTPTRPAAPSVTLSVDKAVISEAGETATYTATLSATSDHEVVVELALTGTASVAVDYSFSDTQIVIAAGALTGTSIATAIDDTLLETTESIVVEILQVLNGEELEDQRVETSIVDNDAIPIVTLQTDTSEFSEDGGTAVVTVSLSAASSLDVTVDLSLTGTATLFSDYLSSAPQIVIASGETSGSIVLSGIQDELDEADETVVVEIALAANAAISGIQQKTLRIVDDDPLPVVSLAVDSTTITEVDGSATITASISEVSGRDVVVDLGFSGTASSVEPLDFTLAATRIVIEAGQTVGSTSLAAVQDLLVEQDETVIVEIASLTNGAELGTQQQTITIIDDDRPPTVSLFVDNQAIPETGGIATITAVLSTAFKEDVLIELEISGTATANQDYFATASQLLIRSGDTTGVFAVIAIPDQFEELAETVVVDILRVTNGVEAGVQRQSVTILDDDTTPSVILSVDTSSIPEDSGVAIFTATLSGPFRQAVVVDLGLSGTASLDADFAVDATRIVIASGKTLGSVTVNAIQDFLDEADESIIFDIESVLNGVEDGIQRQTTTIVDDDQPPLVTLSVDTPTIAEQDGVATVTATLSTIFGQDVVISLGTSGSATEDDDFVLSDREIVVTAGSREGSLTITAADDTLDEADETVLLEILDIVNGVEDGIQEQAVIIADDDNAPTVTLSIDQPEIAEAAGIATVLLTLSAVSSKEVTIDLAVSGTATASADYLATDQRVIIAAGAQSGRFTIIGFQDPIDEDDETVLVEISAVTNAVATTEQHTITIVDDDEPPHVTLSVDNPSIQEGTGVARFTAAVSAASGREIVVELDVSGTAALDADFTISDSHIVISPGSLEGVVLVAALPDRIAESDETVRIGIASVTNATELGEQEQSTTITDHDIPTLPSVLLTADNAEIDERDGTATITATLSEATALSVTVDLGFAGTAIAGSDYAISATQIVIPPGSREATVTITSINDFAAEGDETIVTRIATVSNATEEGIQQVTTVIKDDDIPTVSLLWNTPIIAENQGTAQLTAILSRLAGDPGVPVTVALDFLGTATLGDDFHAETEMVIPAGSLNATISVNAIPDVIFEGNETITASIVSVTNASELGVQHETITIIDDDVPPSVGIDINATKIAEGGGPATVIVTLSTLSGQPVVVDLNYTGTATLGADYSAPRQLVIPAGSTSAAAEIVALQDGLEEVDESIFVQISSASNAIILGNPLATMFVEDEKGDPNFVVTALVAEASGFVAEFNSGLDVTQLNLYDTQTSGFGPADVLLVGQTTGPVTGSLIVTPGNGSARFIKSGLPMLPDSYTVTLRSAANGFTTIGGALLKGNENQIAGSDFVSQFTVVEPAENAVVISAPDFVRGPGQEINLPSNLTRGIPLSVSDGANVQSISVRIRYNPAILDITAAAIAENLPSGATLDFDRTVPGLMVIAFSSSAPLPPGPQVFANLQAFVPRETASDLYGSQQVLDLHDVTIRNDEGSVLPAIVDDALHIVTYFGDSSGNRRINASDAARLARIAALLDSGLEALPNSDPIVVGDISGNGRLNAADASLVARSAALFDIPEIPAIPAGAREICLGNCALVPESMTLPEALPVRKAVEVAEELDSLGSASGFGSANHDVPRMTGSPSEDATWRARNDASQQDADAFFGLLSSDAAELFDERVPVSWWHLALKAR